MKTIINKFFLASAVVMSLTACSDFLDKEPLSQGTEAIVFKTPEHFEQAANALYNVIGWKNLDNKPSYGDIMDRGTDISGLGSNGGGSASEGNWSWDKLSSMQVREYFPDLTQPYFTSGLALVHSRFSTNTFPTWSLAQPFRLLAHNGEINTIRGNWGWMEARESVLSSPALGDVKDIRPIIQPGMSDSASLDNVLEFFVMSGLSLPHAMAMLVPESFNDKNPISEDLKAFYEYHSILMEPWDGPAALLFSDGRFAGGMLDRNGLRPLNLKLLKL